MHPYEALPLMRKYGVYVIHLTDGQPFFPNFESGRQRP